VCRKKCKCIDFSGVYSTIIIGPLVCFIDHKSIGALQTSPELWGGYIETVKLFSFRCPLLFFFFLSFPEFISFSSICVLLCFSFPTLLCTKQRGAYTTPTSDDQVIPYLLWKCELHTEQTKPIHIHISYMFTTLFNIIFLTIFNSPKWDLPFPIGFPSKILCSSSLFYACYTVISSSLFFFFFLFFLI